MAALADAISLVVPQSTTNAAAWFAANQYISVIFVFATGVSPTVMVARVASLDSETEEVSTISMRISGLRFNSSTASDELLSIERYPSADDFIRSKPRSKV
ncbi:hypothetical protein CVT26_003034 [Gymnopilus dilepis]|uniref:Uncharacterized protein n=1 Tax=Gymnopilus dilepis TaxID=231916 RepID=A0A409W2K4_9AGAR|nr:hypothetical protein CVT26_003034 [Gymnopilus dilepis]